MHPEDVDAHHPGTGAAASANCGNPIVYATMCASIVGPHYTAFRTPDVWDVESLRRHYEEN
jgi:hypothetical protein